MKTTIGQLSQSSRNEVFQALAAERDQERQQSEQNNSDIEEESSSNESSRTGPNFGQAMHDRVANPSQFPVSAVDKIFIYNENDEATHELPLLLSLRQAWTWPLCPRFSIKGDIDSIYMIERSLHKLMESLPTKNILSICSRLNPNNKMTSSRFYIDASQLPDPPLVRNNKLEKISLEFFPSMFIGELSIKKSPLNRSFSLYLVNLNVPRLFKENRFHKTEVATITAALSHASELCRQECHDRNEITRVSHFDNALFKAFYGRRSTRMATNEYIELYADDINMFAKNFHKAIKMIAENKSEFLFEAKKSHNLISDSKFKPNREEMVEFASQLNKGGVFVLSLSGVKKNFQNPNYCSDYQLPKEDMWTNFWEKFINENEEQLVKEVKEYAMNKYDVEQEEDLPESFPRFTVGSTIAANKLCIHDLSVHLPCYETLLVPKFNEFINNMINNRIWDISQELNNFMVDTFGSQNRSVNIFFDAGIEIRSTKNHSLLLDIDSLAAQLSMLAADPR